MEVDKTMLTDVPLLFPPGQVFFIIRTLDVLRFLVCIIFLLFSLNKYAFFTFKLQKLMSLFKLQIEYYGNPNDGVSNFGFQRIYSFSSFVWVLMDPFFPFRFQFSVYPTVPFFLKPKQVSQIHYRFLLLPKYDS